MDINFKSNKHIIVMMIIEATEKVALSLQSQPPHFLSTKH